MLKQRGDQVLDALDMDHETLSSKEEAALQALVREYVLMPSLLIPQN